MFNLQIGDLWCRIVSFLCFQGVYVSGGDSAKTEGSQGSPGELRRRNVA